MASSLGRRRSAAFDPLTSPHELSELARDIDVVVRRRTAMAAGLDAATVALLADDVDPIVREKIAQRGDLPASVRARLANDTRWNVREAATLDDDMGAVATDPAQPAVASTPPDIDMLLSRARDDDRAVRLELARRATALADEVLEVLAGDGDALVRHAVASRERALPGTVAARLMTDDEWPVRMAFASRTDLTEAQRSQLSNDHHDKVRAKAAAPEA